MRTFPTPVSLSLSKGCPFFGIGAEEGQPFDRLRDTA